MNNNTVKQHAKLLFGDFHFHTVYSDNEDKATLNLMIEEGRTKGVRAMAPADHHHNIRPSDWESLLADTSRLSDRYEDSYVYPGCEISFKRGHLVAVRPNGFPGGIPDGFRLLYGRHCGIKIIAHPVRLVDRWRDILYPGVHGIEVINGEVLRFFKRRLLPFRTLKSNPMLSLFKHYLNAGLPVAAIGASDAHAVSSVGFGVTGLWLGDGDDTPLRAVRERRCYAATDVSVFMKWELEGRTLTWRTAIDGRAPRRVGVYRGAVHIATVKAAGSMELIEPGCYWIAAGSKTRMGISSPVVVPGLKPAPLRQRELYRILQDNAYIDRQANLEALDEWRPRSTAVWTTVFADYPRFYDNEGKRAYLLAFPMPGRRVFLRERGTLDELCETALWLSRNEVHEYTLCRLSWHTQRSVLRVRATAVPAMLTDRHTWQSRFPSAWNDIQKTADPSTRADIQFRTMRRWRVRLPTGSDGYTVRDRYMTSAVGTVGVNLPEQFEIRNDGRSGPFSAEIQFFR